MEKQSLKNLLIKISSPHPHMLDQLKKYATYLNVLLAEQTDSGLFIEIVQDGLLYIYKDLKTLELLNKPYHPYVAISAPSEKKSKASLSKERMRLLREKRSSFFLGDNIDEKDFPKQGIEIHFETYSEPKEKILMVFQNFFMNFRTFHEIPIEIISSNTLIVHFSTYNSLIEYTTAVESLFVDYL